MIWEPHANQDEQGRWMDDREPSVEEQIADASEDQLRKIVASIWDEVGAAKPDEDYRLRRIKREIEEGVQ